MRILIVEDEIEMATLIKSSCQKEGMVADHVDNLKAANLIIAERAHDFYLLDRRMPDGDGASLIKKIRMMNIASPVILLTALSDVTDKISCLDAGADDYISKPFSMEELMARIRAISRRPALNNDLTVKIGYLTFNLTTRTAEVNGSFLPLPRRQALLLEAFCTRARRTVIREWLIERVYGHEDEINSNSLDSHISRLRKSLDQANAGVLIHVIRGVGYLLKESNHETS